MYKILLFSLLILPFRAFSSGEDLTFDKLVRNLEVRADAFVTSADGAKVLSVDRALSTFRTSSQNPKINAEWKSQFEGLPEVNIEADITVQNDLSINVSVSQYKSLKWDKKNNKNIGEGLVRQETFVVKNFAPLIWVYKANSEKNIVIRLTPLLPTQLEAEALTYPVLGITDAIVTDNANRLWAQGIGGAGQVLGLGSEFGTVYVSFTPFKNSKEIGFVLEDVLTVNLTSKHTLRVRSRSSILGGDIKAKVYGIYLPNKKHPSGTIIVMSADRASRDIL